jgi:hypothetical protein
MLFCLILHPHGAAALAHWWGEEREVAARVSQAAAQAQAQLATAAWDRSDICGHVSLFYIPHLLPEKKEGPWQ